MGAGAAAVILSGVGLAAVATTPTDASAAPLRPPGGQDEARMLARCMRCDRCRSACPTDCIILGTPEDGLARMRTPLVDYREGGCTFCDRCIDACPTGALAPFDPRAEKIGMAQVNADACVAFRSPGSCKLCQDACEFDAIVISEGHPKVVRDRCNGCGMCVAACWGRGKDDAGNTIRGIAVHTLARVTPEEEDANAASVEQAQAIERASAQADGVGGASSTRDGMRSARSDAVAHTRSGASGEHDGEVRGRAASSAHDGSAGSSSARDAAASSAAGARGSRSARGEGER